MEISNLQKIGKNKRVQRTSTCLSPIVEILPFFFFFNHLPVYPPWRLIYFGSFPWLLLSFMVLTWHVLEEYSLLFALLHFLIEWSSFWGSLLDRGYAFLDQILCWWYCVIRYRACSVHCSSLVMLILVTGSRCCSVCPMYSLWFFTLCLINLWETEIHADISI